MDGEGIGQTYCVRDLKEDSVAKTGGNEGLGSKASVIGSRSVDFCGIFAREGTSTVGTPAAIGVDNDLATSEASISRGTADVPTTCWVNDNNCVLTHVFWDHNVYNLLYECGSEDLLSHFWSVLCRY